MSNNNHHDDPEVDSDIRQKLRKLSGEHEQLLATLIDVDDMIIGSLFEVYKTCSKPNCCCQRGAKHGPFAALSYSLDGKVRHKAVREEDKDTVARGTGNYKAFQKRRKRLRQVEKELNKQLDALKECRSREYL